MNAKWYISTLFLIFTLFGAFQDQVILPNQEIVLEFVDTKTNQKEIKSTIAVVKKKLLDVGVSNIIVKEAENGTLKISYYSVVAIDNVKQALIKGNKLALNEDSKKKKKEDTSFSYNIDIYELTNEIYVSNLESKFVFNTKNFSDRFTTHNYYPFLKKPEQYKTDQLSKIAFKFNKNNPFSKDLSSYTEPEVRAGPKRLFS